MEVQCIGIICLFAYNTPALCTFMHLQISLLFIGIQKLKKVICNNLPSSCEVQK